MAYPPPYPHDPIVEIGNDVFMARGSIPLNRLLRISRNMAIVRSGTELTLVDPIRLDAAGEKALSALGTVTRILRLGAFHGLDDAYYVDTFNAALWSQAGGTTYPQPPIDCVIDETTALPFDNAELFCFRGTREPESALLLNRDGGLLLTCDAIQHYGDYRHNNLPARLLMPFIGFPKTTIVGPIWIKLMTTEGTLRPEFERLLGLSFERLLAAHGSLLEANAHAGVTAAVARAFE